MKFILPHDTPAGQSEAVNADEKLITVGAGAGTGKTWVLSQRYLRLLVENSDILPQDILTLTYTETAAGEMNDRIKALVIKELDNFDDEERKREIEDGLSDLWISTIHSFSTRLIRESGLKLDVDPMASVISAKEEQNFWEDIKNAAEFANLRVLARAFGDKRLQDIAKELDSDKYFTAAVNKWKAANLSKFAGRTAELHEASGFTWEDMLKWAENDFLVDDTRPLVEEILLPEWQTVWNIWINMELPPAKNPNGAGALLNALLAKQKKTKSDREALKDFYRHIMDNTYISTPGGKQVQPFVALAENLHTTLGEWRGKRPKIIKDVTFAYDKPFHESEMRMRKVLMKFCALSWGMWSMMKQRRGLLSFYDMISHARSIISKGGVTREFKHILVDEFQDTDPLQFEMIKSLADRSQDTRLFAVGDPKQSIYKFRYADLSLFADTIRNADRKIELDTSFRTRASLLKRINDLFSRIWINGLGSSASMHDLRYEPLRAADNKSERDSGTMPDFRIILEKNNSDANEARKKLADVIAREIFKYVRDGFTIWDKEEEKIRKVMFSDFAILSRARSGFDILEDALSRYGIKSVRDKSDDFLGRGEINDIVCMLRAASDMNDSFALTGWLMSPFSYVKEKDAIKSFLQVLGSDKERKPSDILKENLPEAFSRLEYLSLVGELEGPAGLLSIYDRKREWLSCYSQNDRLRVLRNFRHAVSLARDFQGSGTSGLAACAEWLTRAVKNELGLEEPAWHDRDENAVRLGAVHSAKGLEYPVVIIFEHRTSKNVDRDNPRPSKNLGLVFRDMPDEIANGAEIKPQGILWEKLLSEQGDAEEETRLFYVAATRAQDSLIFCGLTDNNGQAYKDTWTKLMLSNSEDVKPKDKKPKDKDDFDDSKVQAVTVNKPGKSKHVLDVVSTKNALRQISATSFALFEFCPFAWRRSYRQGINLKWELNVQNDNDDEDYSGGADLGSLAHWVLSLWPNKYELDYLLGDNDVFSFMPVKLRGAWRDKAGRKKLHEWLVRFSKTDLFEKLKGENVRREFRFRLKLNESTALAGAIDSFYDNNIVDYKITRFESVPPGLYESQLDFYALAMHDMFGYESVNTSVVFLREGIISERACDDFDSIRERVILASEVCASESYAANLKNCGMCPFRKGCVKSE